MNLNSNDYNNYAFYEMKPDFKNKTGKLKLKEITDINNIRTIS